MKTKNLTNISGIVFAIIVVMGFSLLPSCRKENYNSYGFDCDFGRNSTGLTMMSIGSSVASITLSGTIYMDSGELMVQFIDPDGFIVYTHNYFSPGNYFVDETFKATRGIWKLRYTSLEGKGSIDLHANFK